MTDSKKNFTSKLNTIYFLILGCLLGSLLIFNSDYVNNQKASAKLNEEKSRLFNRIISTRKLQANTLTDDPDDFIYETDEVCSRASDDLQEYYKTSDPSKIELNNDAFECEDKDKEYMQALIELFKSFAGDKSSTTSTQPGGVPGSGSGDGNGDNDGNGGGRRILRNLLDDDDKENIKKYGMSRILASLIFLIISPLCIIGWIVCWFCCCCNCCCCCCCKKPECKIPCFIFSYVFYALVVGCSIYGLTQASKIFTGLANTECSLLQFFDQIIYGEQKNDGSPKWIGIEGVSNLMDDLEGQINDMKNSNLMDQLNYYKGSIQEEKRDLENSFDNAKNFFYNDNYDPKGKYLVEYENDDNHPVSDNKYLRGKYILDVIPAFINKNGNDRISAWKQEINLVDGTAQGVLDDASDNFGTLINKLDGISTAIGRGKTQLSNLRKPFDNVYNDISEILYDISDYSDKNGKITVNLVFGVLAFINICLAVLMLFILMFSGKSCIDCSFCRCIFKFATHILWNILAILMILSFLVGSILALVGRVGGDLMSFVSFLVSQENFRDPNPVLLNKLSDGKDILDKCILGNGDLSQTFGLQNFANDFNSVANSRTSIDNSIAQFNQIKANYQTYNKLYESLRKRTEFTEDTSIELFNTDGAATDTANSVKLKDIINLLNEKIQNPPYNEKWELNDGDANFKCGDGSDQSNPPSKLHPWTCEPKYRDWVSSSTDTNIKIYSEISSDIIELLKKANGTIETSDDNSNYYSVLNDLKYEYTDYLDQYLGVLGFFREVVDDIMGVLQQGIGNNGSPFSFLNGKFIFMNLKIILKYLKYSLGKDFYSVGICLIIVGFSLMLSISSTILLIVIINIDLENNKKLAQNTEIPNYPVSNDGRVIGFKYD